MSKAWSADTLAKLQAHLAKHGFGDIEVNMSGGYDPTQTDPNSKLIQAQLATYRHTLRSLEFSGLR